MQAKGSCMNYDHCINYCFCPMAIRRIRHRTGNLQSSLMNPTTDQLADKIKTIPWPIALVRWFGCDPVQPMTHLSRRRDIDDPAATTTTTDSPRQADSFQAVGHLLSSNYILHYHEHQLSDTKARRRQNEAEITDCWVYEEHRVGFYIKNKNNTKFYFLLNFKKF